MDVQKRTDINETIIQNHPHLIYPELVAGIGIPQRQTKIATWQVHAVVIAKTQSVSAGERNNNWLVIEPTPMKNRKVTWDDSSQLSGGKKETCSKPSSDSSEGWDLTKKHGCFHGT